MSKLRWPLLTLLFFPLIASAQSNAPFLGLWDLTLHDATHSYPSWLELKQEGGHLHATMTGRWGNARPLPSASISGNQLTFVSPKAEEGSDHDLVFTGALRDGHLTGTLNGPDNKPWSWIGDRAPKLTRTVTQWGEPIQLFNGKDLTGWHTNPGSGSKSWTVQNGLLTTPGNGPELYSDQRFQDFKLHVEFNCGQDSNSGVYLRGRYEVQIETESQAEPPSHHTGGVYGFLAPHPELPRTPDTWQTFDTTFVGRTVTVVLNGTTVIDHQEIPGLTGGAVDSHEADPGPIYLQGSEKGHVQFRKITLTPAR